MIHYITKEEAIAIHRETVEKSGGGSYDILNDGYLDSFLVHMKNDDYYPSFEDKLTHLIWAANKSHCFADGNKRISITLGAHFLLINGYLCCVQRFLYEMENISYHLAAGRISKELLQALLHSIIQLEIDFDEGLKLEYLMVCAEGLVGFDES